MDIHTNKLAPYMPRWLLRQIARSPGRLGSNQTYSFEAAVLVLDIVNFTALTESMASSGPRHIETLRQILDTVFSNLVSVVHAYGGDMFRFSGDAITCIWPVEAEAEPPQASVALQACAAALNMQALMSRFAQVDTPHGPLELKMRTGIGYGAITIHIVGSPDQQHFVLSGPGLERAFQAEVSAQPNQVRMHTSVPEVAGASLATDANGILQHINDLVRPCPPAPPAFVDDPLIYPFIHAALVKRHMVGSQGFMAEFRPVATMFIRCEHAYGKPDISAWLNAWIEAAQTIAGGLGGWLSHIEISDKGNIVMILFGAPLAHEDDTRRAAACALALQETSRTLFPHLRLHIGVTRGNLFTGVIGASDRTIYTLIGDEINLAARLMEIAPAGQTIVSARVRNSTAHHFTFQDLGAVQIRGKSEAVPLYVVLEAHSEPQEIVHQYLDYRQALIGRAQEIGLAKSVMEQAWAGQGQTLVISGEAGIGKSHLVSDLVCHWVERGGMASGGNCLSFTRGTPYLPWRWIISALCGLTNEQSQANQIEKLAQTLSELPSPAGSDYWPMRLPLLAEVLGIGLPDNSLTSGLQEQTRRDNTFATIQALLQARAKRAPLLVLIEDAHWADDLSLQMATQLGNHLSQEPILMVLVHRPLPQPLPALWENLQQLPYLTHIELGELTAQASRSLIQKYLGDRDTPDELVEMIFERAQGHPFFTEELIRMFQAIACIHLEGEKVTFDQQRAAAIHLPDTVQGVIQARLDQLDEKDRLTIKVASVIGRLFPYRVLAGVYPIQIQESELKDHLDSLEQMGLTLLEQLRPELEYIFKHSITHEVVYESLVFAQRQRLHTAVAHWYETQYGSNLEPYYALLAHHYGRAGQRDQELYYRLLAAHYAMRVHAINEAINHYEVALGLLDRYQEAERAAGVLMHLGRAIHFTGQYERAQAHFQEALEIYERLGDHLNVAEACYQVADRASVHNLDSALAYTLRGLEHAGRQPDGQRLVIAGQARLSTFQRSKGNHTQAQQALETALNLAQQSNDPNDLWICYRAWSLHHYSRGEKQAAFESGKKVVESIEQTNVGLEHRIIALNNLACFAKEIGDMQAALDAGKAGLELARWAGILSEQVILASSMAEIYNHLGNWQAAQSIMDEGLRLLAQNPHPYHEVALHIEAGLTAYGRRDWGKAIEHWLWAEDRSHAGTQQLFAARLCAYLAMGWLGQGDIEQANQWAERARTLASQHDQPGALAMGWRTQAMIEQQRRNWPAAQAALEQGLALARDLNDAVESAYLELEQGRLLLATGQVQAGQALLRQVEERAHSISLHPTAQAARYLLEATDFHEAADGGMSEVM